MRPDAVPERVASYLEMVRPATSGPTQTILNHAWIIGDEEQVSWSVQARIHQLLQPQGLRLAGGDK